MPSRKFSRASARWAAGGSMVVLVAAAALAASPAAAAGSDKGTTVGEVVVTAQFREQSLQSTPIAITAVNAQMLQSRGQTSIEQVANQAPNVTLKPQGAAFGPALGASIRGVGQYDFNPALEPGVGIYVDDVYYPTLTGSILDLLDLDRVEILRGPQGTLAGQNSIGGAVKLYSKKPTGDGTGYLEATYGGLNHLEARGGVDFALVPDKLLVRLSAVTNHYDGYVTRLDYACANPGSGLPNMTAGSNCVLGHEGGKSYSALRTAVRWLVNDKIEVNVMGDYTFDNSENPATTLIHTTPLSPGGDALTTVNGVHYGSQFIPANPFVSYASFNMPASPMGPPFNSAALTASDTSLYKGWGVSTTVDWKLAANLALKSITAYRAYVSDFAEDNDVSPLPLGLGIEHLSHRQFTQELRLNGGLFNNAVEYTVGGFYLWENTTYATHQDLWYPGIALDFLGNDPVIAHSKAGFAQATWHITDKLNLIGGIRYTDQDKSYLYTRLNRDGTPNAVLGALNGDVGKYSGSRWDYRADLSYDWTPNFMTYAEFSTGFKGGGINPRPFTVAQVQPFGPETLEAYEIGFKSMMFDRRLRLNAAAFYNNYNAIQLALLSCPQFGGPGPCALPVNAGDAHVKGAEVEFEAHPVGGLELDGSASYLDFAYIGSTLNANTGILPGMVHALYAEVEVELRGAIRLRSRRQGQPDAAHRRLLPEHALHQRVERPAEQDQSLHPVERPAHLSARVRRLGRFGGDHQPDQQALLRDHLRPDRRGRRPGGRAAGHAAGVVGHGSQELLIDLPGGQFVRTRPLGGRRVAPAPSSWRRRGTRRRALARRSRDCYIPADGESRTRRRAASLPALCLLPIGV